MTRVPGVTRPPLVEVKILERTPDAGVCEWSGLTGRMCPESIYVTFHAVLGAPQWWVSVTLEGPTLRRNGKPGTSIAHQVFYRDPHGDTLVSAPVWVREFVRVNEPPDYMRGA